MSSAIKPIVIGAGLSYVVYKTLGMYQLSEEVETVVNKVSFKIDSQRGGLMITCDCSVDNPTNQEVNISRPVVTLKIGSTGFATPPTKETYTIKALSRSSIGSYSFFIAWSDLGNYILRAAPGLALKLPAIISGFQSLKGKTKQEQFIGIKDILKSQIKVPISVLTNFYVGIFGVNFIKVPTFETPLIEY